LFPRTAVHQLWWLAVAGAGVAARYVHLRTRPARISHSATDEPTARLLREQEVHGYNAHSLVSIAPGARFWSCPEIDGAITYNEFGKIWLVPGDPLASEENSAELTRRFIEAAREEGRYAAFMPASERFAIQAASLGLRAVKISAAPYFDLTTWGPRGDRAKKARAGVNQARRAGVRVSCVDRIDQTLKRETALLCRDWLKARRCAMKLGWLFALDPFQHAARKKFFTARDESGNLVGFLAASPMPARAGWYLEDVLRSPTAPSGTADLLVVEALTLLQRDGARIATLGTSPLATEGTVAPEVGNNELVADLVRMATSCFAIVYNFEGLRRFKTKFAPTWWESEYVLFPRDLKVPPHLIRAFIKAIVPEGASKLVAGQIVRAIKRGSAAPGLFGEVDNGSVAGTRKRFGLLPADNSAMNQENLKCGVGKPEVELAADSLVPRRYLGQFVSVDGLRLHYVSKGTGKPVVFIHGNPGSHHDYSTTVLSDVAQSYRTFAFDRPGHGYSERRRGSATTVEVQARLVRDAMRDLGVDKPVIVGHSWGGALALALALQHADELSGLVLLAPAAYPSDSPWWTALPHVPVLGALFVKALTPLLGRRIVRDSLKDAYHPAPVPEDYLQSSEVLWTRPGQVRACANDDRSLNGSLDSLSNRYGEIRMPVVIVTGDSDLLLKPEEQAHRLHQAIPGSQLVSLAETGHQIPQTRPEAVIAAIETVWEMVTRR
jgi:pimeloyl-ACP methyl ester carboxylesterase